MRILSNDTNSTIIGRDCGIEGTIEFQGTVYVEGSITGKILGTEGTVVIGEKAVVNADIVVNKAIIRGEVNGKVEAGEKIEVGPPGRVFGDIHAPIISIETGAVFDGKCGMYYATDAAFVIKSKRN